ncbi:MAG: DNA methyltransferase, partial [Anaerolineae bacterium]|nr:DNA methyltransferase [Anaerolineae bacterium]
MPDQLHLSTASTPEPEASGAPDREVYRRRLREALRDPAFRATEGFPIGSDEAILALSDPPYYTACPNPFLPEILARWQEERRRARAESASAGADDRSASAPADPFPFHPLGEPETNDASTQVDARRASAQAGRFPIGAEPYHREPFAADVSEGKNDPIYNAHSYHTKVPHRAIMRYILHYTDPGDIVLDGFCGTGMTGVAAQLCADKRAVESLGYRVADDGTVLDQKGRPFSRLGARRAILVDLCPAATFIAYNYNTPVDPDAFEREARRILQEVEEECGWMYETWHWPPSHSHSPAADSGKGVKGRILYTVWSDVFRCPLCNAEIVFWDVAVDRASGRVREQFSCPSCNALHTKRTLDRAWETVYDRALRQPIRRARQVPVLICYTVGKKRYEKTPDVDDLALLAQIEEADIPYWFPTDPLPEGEKTRDPINLGITHVHHFYTRRNLWTLAALWKRLQEAPLPLRRWLLFTFEQAIPGMSRWARYVPKHYSQVNQGLSGTLYIASQVVEASLDYVIRKKIPRLAALLRRTPLGLPTVTSTQSAHNLRGVPDDSVDYIFVDPPFGANLMYSELNF